MALDLHLERSPRTLPAALIGLAGAAWAAVWLQRLPFFDDDYSRWIAAAETTPWPRALGALFNPWGGSDGSWGFAYRPLIVVWFKLFAHGGASPSLFFGVKALLFGALVAVAYACARRLAGSALAALAVPLLLLGSHGPVESLAWGGDMAVLADLLMLLAILAFVGAQRDDRPWPWLAALLLALLAMQTKGNGKLLAGVFASGLSVQPAPTLRRRLVAAAAACAAMALPLGALLHGVPFPFAGPGGIAPGTGYTWHVPSWGVFAGLLWPRELNLLWHPAAICPALLAALFPLGWLLIVLAVYGRPRATPEAQLLVPLCAWAALALGSLPFYPAINPFFQIRYLLDTLLPLSILLAVGAAHGVRRLPGRARRPAMGLAAIVAAVQLGRGTVASLEIRESLGSVSVIADRLNRRLEGETPALVRLYLNDYLMYGHWPALPGQAVAPRDGARALSALTIGGVALSWGLPLGPDCEVVAAETGRTGAWIERWLPPFEPPGVLLRRIPPSPLRSQGRELAAAHRWAEAIPALTQALAERDTPFERNLLGQALLEMGQPARAAEALAPLARLDPTRVEIGRTLALALREAGRHAEACDVYEKLARKAPDDPAVGDGLLACSRER